MGQAPGLVGMIGRINRCTKPIYTYSTKCGRSKISFIRKKIAFLNEGDFGGDRHLRMDWPAVAAVREQQLAVCAV